MKIFYLKKIRERVCERYEVRKSNAGNDRDKPWCIWTGPKTSLAYHNYTTKEEAIHAMRQFWWEEADKFLWENKNRRKKKNYIW